MTKYDALGAYLNHSDALQITLSFKDMERILGFELPAAAKHGRHWWANQPARHARYCDAWLRAGWQVFFADMQRREVTFVKYRLAEAAPGSLGAREPKSAISRMAGRGGKAFV